MQEHFYALYVLERFRVSAEKKTLGGGNHILR